jgi:hypothetical protein
MNTSANQSQEVILSEHHIERRKRRIIERSEWLNTPKIKRKEKKLSLLGDQHVDYELYPALKVINELGIRTEFSCAGVSILDEPEDHSLYAYVTLLESVHTKEFVEFILDKMKYRILISYEPARQRYDLSSYFIKHNRSFCHYLYLVSREYQGMLIKSISSK